MKQSCVALLLFLAACTSSAPAPQPVAATSPSVDEQLANLQTSLTELLERLDVLNARIAKLESGGQPPSAVQPPPSVQPQGQPRAAVLHSADIAEIYRRALVLFGQGKQSEARAAFQQAFDAEPNGHLADNALFWIGESYYAAGDYSNAMRYYERVTKEFAEENKAADAMFKLGMAYEKSSDLGMARRTFDECVRKYPYSTAAASARVELKRIKY